MRQNIGRSNATSGHNTNSNATSGNNTNSNATSGDNTNSDATSGHNTNSLRTASLNLQAEGSDSDAGDTYLRRNSSVSESSDGRVLHQAQGGEGRHALDCC